MIEANRGEEVGLNIINRRVVAEVIAAQMTLYRSAREAGEPASAWGALERAHIVSQPFFSFHLSSHGHMFTFALSVRDWREAAGQVLRLALVPLGSLTGRLPVGNTGRARISPFPPMPIPTDLAALISQHDKSVSRR